MINLKNVLMNQYLVFSFRKNNDINASTNSQIMNLLESSKSLESKEIFVRPKQMHGMLYKCIKMYINILLILMKDKIKRAKK